MLIKIVYVDGYHETVDEKDIRFMESSAPNGAIFGALNCGKRVIFKDNVISMKHSDAMKNS